MRSRPRRALISCGVLLLAAAMAVIPGGAARAAPPDSLPQWLSGRSGDFNGDGLDDLITFTRGPEADVWVALNGGGGFGPAEKWHDYFAVGTEEPLVGDFNGDGRDDIVTFTCGSGIWVALNIRLPRLRPEVRTFGVAERWSDSLGCSNYVVGDFNGDGRDDIADFGSFGGGTFVALSTGAGFGAAVKWNTYVPGAPIEAGDVDGDGMDDLVGFDIVGKVWVAPSRVYWTSRTGLVRYFDGPFLRYQLEPATSDHRTDLVGDFDGDGRDDFADVRQLPDGSADVAVMISYGTGFVPGVPLTNLEFGSALFGVGRFYTPGRDDLVMYTGVYSTADTRVFTARSVTLSPPFSTGVGFLPPEQRSNYFAVYHEVPMGATFCCGHG
ncbi:VCBS repeat-containing protein [Frankia sp. Mgl5]|uniref:FG-GAP repeat domain-containing protein n=1 Tax=Frankia sp. Mgl5 TaxID=2933793 RepID=UPI00200DB129|nr:VCBS repeat-containing protein [Frankia sp. Mgl5]MCK9929008.1 VCBS repeat-containing protein [Frankia sp. Mgl5]